MLRSLQMMMIAHPIRAKMVEHALMVSIRTLALAQQDILEPIARQVRFGCCV